MLSKKANEMLLQCDTGSPCIEAIYKYKTSYRAREREGVRGITDSALLCKSLANLYWSASEQLALQRLSRRLSQTCECV
jgi:hypothetical protein